MNNPTAHVAPEATGTDPRLEIIANVLRGLIPGANPLHTQVLVEETLPGQPGAHNSWAGSADAVAAKILAALAEDPPPTVADVLTSAADALTVLRHARVCAVEATWTIHGAATDLLPGDPSGAYRLACRALDVLIAHRTAIGEDPGALDRWNATFSRDELAEQMRAASATAGQAVTA